MFFQTVCFLFQYAMAPEDNSEVEPEYILEVAPDVMPDVMPEHVPDVEPDVI